MNRANATLALLVFLSTAALGSQAVDAPNAQTTAAEVARSLEEHQLDPDQCYRVSEMDFAREDLRIALTSGYLIFAKPILGVRTAAVFVAAAVGGDAEALLFPPYRGERMSLARYTESPNLDEHFKTALFLFTDRTADELLKAIAVSGRAPDPVLGLRIAKDWNPVLRNLGLSFETRMVRDLLGQDRASGFFYMAFSGVRLGNVDIMYDPRVREQLLVGQLAEREGRNYFDVWTAFPSRSARKRPSKPISGNLQDFQIDAVLDADLAMKARTSVTYTQPEPAERVLPFFLSGQMQITGALLDGEPIEVFRHDSLRAGLMSHTGNEELLLIAKQNLQPGSVHKIVFQHEGKVITKAGDRIYYVGSRGNWYPQQSLNFALYDLTFHYPANVRLVSTGELLEERTEGNVRFTHRRASSPVRFAGFNLGDYESAHFQRGPNRVEVCANRRLENALRAPVKDTTPFPAVPRRRADASSLSDIAPAAPSPTAHLEELASDVMSAFDYFTTQFGPPPLKTLTVSPIPGGFGQGFPGLVYLSTMAYLDPAQRPVSLRGGYQQVFFSEILEAHEIAHQWWGNLVVSAGHQDDWIMEALANYSALLYLEKKKGPAALDSVLEAYRSHLLAPLPNGEPLESAGPITAGYRLVSSQTPDAWRVITYEKGSWIMHMLRRRMGDARFLPMLREICVRYRFAPISAAEFGDLAREFAPKHSLDNFFDNWVYGTGIPVIKLTSRATGNRLDGTLTLTNVEGDWSAEIPIEVRGPKQKPLTVWINGTPDGSSFSIPVSAPGAKAQVQTANVLSKR